MGTARTSVDRPAVDRWCTVR